MSTSFYTGLYRSLSAQRLSERTVVRSGQIQIRLSKNREFYHDVTVPEWKREWRLE
jgi:hypothetical protein